jgi:hypothetical protein
MGLVFVVLEADEQCEAQKERNRLNAEFSMTPNFVVFARAPSGQAHTHIITHTHTHTQTRESST